MNRRFFGGLFFLMLCANVFAQGNTASPYSQYGLGLLSEQSQGFSRGMNGVGVGLRKGNAVNTLNPASYSSIDSLTMVFDMGLSGQLTNFKEDGVKVNAKGACIEYAVGSFRLFRKVGMAFGILPYSNVGYKYTASKYLDSTNGTITETFEGSGGLHQAFIGAGWQIASPLSVGVNVAYLWGTSERTITNSNSTYINSLSRTYSSTVSSYKIDFGLQWSERIGRKDMLTLGATVGLGHKLGADPTCMIINVNNADTTLHTVENGLSLPMTYGVGAAWYHGNKLMVGADVTLQKWGSLDFPVINSQGQYALESGLLKDRWQVKVGADYVPDALNRSYLRRVHYRMGAGYTTPYYSINGNNGPKELSVSAGLGLPLQNSYNNRSVLNLGVQWVHTSATGMITENTFRINLGLTFNERWFAKWKID
jgi:hypothetical protein